MTEIRYMIENIDTVFTSEDLSVLLFYSKNINNNIASKIFFSLRKKTMFDLHNNLETLSDPSDDLPAYFNISYLQDAISFINSQLIPAMQSETLDIWQKYGGFSSLKSQINNNLSNDWSSELYIQSDYVPESFQYYINIANEIKTLFQKSLSLNTPLIVSYLD